jgi:hypothetical protein
MTSISHFTRSPRGNELRDLCLRKATYFQYVAHVSADLRSRRTYLYLAKLWREMAVATVRGTGEPSKESGVVIPFPSRSNSRLRETQSSLRRQAVCRAEAQPSTRESAWPKTDVVGTPAYRAEGDHD